MRYILALVLLAVSAANTFAQLNLVEKEDSEAVIACFPNAQIIVPSDRVDPLMTIKPSEKIHSGMLVEISCFNNSSTKKTVENLFVPIVPDKIEKP